ncbi:doublecortin domain-containing protein 2C isoform X3 [Peromyscus eremicus]|uniref:doublecortin domain-containing protein 2C isoform X3 n=1 Tax=Peromyscus eremicus TaxID=42410 RepID=UPI0027DCBBA6|nr:doublecortin domain-containing protein 2C isoform X3 [Peromyscus eremicus]
MGTRGPYALVDTTPAKTILVYRNGDQFYVGRKFVFSRRRVANFEALLEQLTEQVDVPFGVRRLYTPTHGHQVLELDALQAGGKYVAAGRERFKKLDYIHIVPRKPSKMRKLKEIKPVVHCDINVPSRWQTQSRTSRHINVFTNGRIFIPPIKIIIPKFSLSDWNSVLAIIGEKVFPLGGVRKLFTMDGHLLDNSKDLQDNYFYVAAGLETFKSLPYWKSPRVPSEIQQRFGGNDKYIQTKKKVEFKRKEPLKSDNVLPKIQDSVYYAKEKKKTPLGPLVQSGAEGDVYKAQTPAKEAQEALEVKEDPEVKVEMPVDQVPAEIVKEIDEIGNNNLELESGVEKEVERLYEDIDRKRTWDMHGDMKGDHSRMSFKKRFPLRHYRKRKEKRFTEWTPQILRHEGGICTQLEEKCDLLVSRNEPTCHVKYKTMIRTTSWCKGEQVLSLHPKDLVAALDLLSRVCANTGQVQGPHVFIASLKNLRKNKEVVPTSEKEQHDIIEEKNIPTLPETHVEAEVQREPSMEQELQESSSTQDQRPKQQESPGQSSLRPSSPEQQCEGQEVSTQSSLGPSSPKQQHEQQEISGQSTLRPPSPKQQHEQREVSRQSTLGPPSPEQQHEQQEVSGQSTLRPPSPEQQHEQQEVSRQSSLGPPSTEQHHEQQEVSGQSTVGPPSPEQQHGQQEVSEQSPLRPPSPEQQLEQQEISGQSSLRPSFPEQQHEQEVSRQSSLRLSSPEQQLEQEISGQSTLRPPSPEQQLGQQEVSGQSSLGPPSPEQQHEQESSKESSLGPFLEQQPAQ